MYLTIYILNVDYLVFILEILFNQLLKQSDVCLCTTIWIENELLGGRGCGRVLAWYPEIDSQDEKKVCLRNVQSLSLSNDDQECEGKQPFQQSYSMQLQIQGIFSAQTVRG